MIEFDHVFYTYEAIPKKKRHNKTQSDDLADWGNKPDSYWALQDITFTLQDGEFLGIAGHTGSGKSTLIQHMNGLAHPTRGRVLVNGADISNKEDATRARSTVGLVFQYPEHQLFAATVFDDVAFGPRNMGVPAEDIEDRVRDAMRLVELDFDELRDKSPFELSGGQQRRVAFAGVLAMRPRTLILDEPVAGLDPESREDFLQLIAHLHESEHLTVVMVSHSMDDLARFCTRILVLNTGTVFTVGTPAEVFADAPALKAVGLDVPSPQHLANTLRAGGLNLPEGVLYTTESLAQAIATLYRAKA